MAALNGDCVDVSNIVLPDGIIPPVITPPVLGVFHNPNLDPPLTVERSPAIPFNNVFLGFLFPTQDLGGDCVLLNQDLFWNNHLHIIPRRFDLGNILATQVRNYEIYNGFFVPREVNNIIDVGFDGIAITSGNDTPPFTIPARSSEFFEVTVGTVGPPQVNATKTYEFTAGPEELVLTITGTRIVVFPLVPFTPINEIYSFKTDIQKGVSGFEQRTALRDLPRLTYAFPYRRSEEEMAFSENQFYEWMGRLWAMPVWVDETVSTADVAAAAVTIPVETTADRDWRAGAGELGVIYDNFGNFEAFEVAAVNPTSIDLSVPLESGFPAGSSVLPMRFAWLRNPIETAPWLITLRDMQLTFDVVEGIDYGNDFADLPSAPYKGLPLFDEEILINALQYQRTFEKRVDRVDTDIGLIDQNQVQDYPEAFDQALFIAETRTEIARLKRLLMSFKGKQKTVWMPTHRDDFQIEDDLTTPTNQIRVKFANYDIFLDDNKRTRADIRITYVDGTVDRREILNSVRTSSFEEITLDSNVSQDVTQANVARIEFLVRRRLTVDELKFTWNLEEKAVIQVGFKDVLS